MFGLFLSPVAAARRALAQHLPQTLTDLPRISSPLRTRALRVLFARDAAFEYYEDGGQWFRVTAAATGVPIGVVTTEGPHAVASVVAADIAAWHRRAAYPLANDAHPSNRTELERAESEDRFAEAMSYLNAVSRGKIDCSETTIELAESLWNQLDDEMVDSLGEQRSGIPIEISVLAS